MKRAIVKVRLVAGSLVVSIPEPVLARAGLKAGNMVMVEAMSDKGGKHVRVTKEPD